MKTGVNLKNRFKKLTLNIRKNTVSAIGGNQTQALNNMNYLWFYAFYHTLK